MATNLKYVAAHDKWNEARIALEKLREKHEVEMAEAVTLEAETHREMCVARDTFENWV